MTNLFASSLITVILARTSSLSRIAVQIYLEVLTFNLFWQT